jgi:hypothetical protein
MAGMIQDGKIVICLGNNKHYMYGRALSEGRITRSNHITLEPTELFNILEEIALDENILFANII